MNRWLIAAVFGLMSVGCAVGVEDPEPPPAPDPVQRPAPPAQTFSQETVEVNHVADGVDHDLQVPAVPVDMAPMPGR